MKVEWLFNMTPYQSVGSSFTARINDRRGSFGPLEVIAHIRSTAYTETSFVNLKQKRAQKSGTDRLLLICSTRQRADKKQKQLSSHHTHWNTHTNTH